MKIDIPCKVGDTVWGISFNRRYVSSGTVAEIYFNSEDMTPVIRVKKMCSGHWGVRIFATEEEAKEHLSGMIERGHE